VSSSFARIDTGPIYRRVAEAIGTRITTRELTPGEALPTETALALQLGVNRSTVREALRELESRRLVGRRPGSKRMFVIRPGNEVLGAQLSDALLMHDVTIRDVWEMLMMLEPPAAELAARRRRKPQLDALRSLTALPAMPGSSANAIAHVQNYFRTLVEATQNHALALAHEPAIQLLGSSLALMIDRLPQARQRIATAQARITAAIARKAAQDASDWMTRHIRDFRRGFDIAGMDFGQRISP
jgi:GntR family transcriptional regulator, transcriptional repressor for pyruvate dehydrogenase complex